MKFVVNIGRQLGSGGREIGEKLSKVLDISFYDKKLINLASRESGLNEEFFERADEQASSAFSRIMGLRFPFTNMDSLTLNDYLSNDMLFKIQSDVILRLSGEHSCLFIGRCADYILRKNPHCVNIFIHAPLDYRIDQVMKKQNLTEEAAFNLIEKTDKRRSGYYNYYTNKIWGMSSSYHLSLESTIFSMNESVDFLHAFIRQKLKL